MLILAALVIYMIRVGLDTADKFSLCLGLLVAVAALVAPYLLPAPGSQTSGPGVPSESTPSPMPSSPSGRDSGIDLQGAQGVQIVQDSATGTQTNTFPAS